MENTLQTFNALINDVHYIECEKTIQEQMKLNV